MNRLVHHLDQVGWALELRQHNGSKLRRVPIEWPTIIVVRQGAKQIRGRGAELTVRVGEAIAFAPGHAWDMINTPGAEGVYHSDCLAIAPEVLAEFSRESSALSQDIVVRDARRIAPFAPEFAAAFDRAWTGIGGAQQVPEVVARHRVREILVWLGSQGVAFSLDWRKEVVARVRGLLSGRPAHRWQASEVARSLGMSEATLRRHLATAGVSFSELLIDVRMTTALTLLQATGQSILEIAAATGYASPSRFAVRFRRRFGQAPSELRAPVARN